MTIENLLRLHGHDTTKRVLPDGQIVFDPKDTPMPDQTAAPLTADELREIADAEMLPDETVQAMVTELLAARARITQLEMWKANAEVTLAEDARYIHEANSGALVRRLGVEHDAARAEIAALRNDLDAKTSDFDAACRHLGEARERIAELEADRGRWKERSEKGQLHRAELIDQRNALRARIAELEAQTNA